MTRTNAVRGVLLLAGLAAGIYGAVLLLSLDLPRLVSTVLWLAGGVVVHDGLLAPLVVGVGVVVSRVLPRAARLPVVVALVVWGTVTVAAVPVLSGLGGKPDNDTILDRPYWPAWVALTVVVAVAAAVATAVRGRRSAN